MNKETDILFKPFLTELIIRGFKRKTRRLVKAKQSVLEPWGVKSINEAYAHTEVGVEGGRWGCAFLLAGDHGYETITSRYGGVGDCLWVKETWKWEGDTAYTDISPIGTFLYKLDDREDIITGWKSSMFMPKIAARLFLQITDLKVERLHDISDEDCVEEGIRAFTKDTKTWKYGIEGWDWATMPNNPKDAFKRLWIQINGKKSWDENPYLWVISFEVDKQKSKI